MRTIKLTLAYDGTDFAGWQRQDGQSTVQGCLEKALQAMTGQAVSVRGAGRTDAGVHAEGQVASVEVASRIPTLGFLRGLNTHVPPEIAVLEVTDMPAGWNARHDARGKIYRYRIWNHPVRSPRLARQSWHVYDPLDTHGMREAAARLVGEHDFRGTYVADLASVVDLEAVRASGLRLGVDPLGGAAVAYWGLIGERYDLDLTVTNESVDPTFGFMTLDWDGKIRMDPSSPFAMARLVELRDRFDIALGNDADADRHGVVVPGDCS